MASGARVLRALIREVAKGMGDIDPEHGMALAVEDHGNSRYYILYAAGFMKQTLEEMEEESQTLAEKALEDLKATYKKNKSWVPFPYSSPAAQKKWIKNEAEEYMRKAINDWLDDSDRAIRENDYMIVAMMKVFKERSKKFPQWDASTVELAAAETGWGPFMYDVVMSAEGGLVPDRSSVSDSARGVWRKYKDSRPDVEAKPLDDPEAPRTKSKRDDTSRFHGDDAPKGKPPENPLNYAYFLESDPVDVSALISMHKKTEPTLRKHGINISNLASQFFSVKYRS